MHVTAAETPLKEALDLFYSWLIQLIGPSRSDKSAMQRVIVVALAASRSTESLSIRGYLFQERSGGCST